MASDDTLNIVLVSLEANYTYLGRGWADRAFPDWKREFAGYPGPVLLDGSRAWMRDPDKRSPAIGEMHAWLKARMPAREVAPCGETRCANGWRSVGIHFRTKTGADFQEFTCRCSCDEGKALTKSMPTLVDLEAQLLKRPDCIRVVTDPGSKDRMPMRSVTPVPMSRDAARMMVLRGTLPGAERRKDWTKEHERRQDGDGEEER